MNIPQIQGTSDANGFTITGMPAAIQPARTGWFVVRAEDNDVDLFGLLLFTASNPVLTLYPSAASAGGSSLWTTSGTKTLFATQISYPLF